MNLLKFTKAKKIKLLIDLPGEWLSLDMKTHSPKKKGDICIVDEETAEFMEKFGYAEILD